MTPAEQKAALYAAVNRCDAMIVQSERDNDAERLDHYKSERRLSRYQARRASFVEQRRGLEALYVSLYGENPWADIAF